MTKTKDKDAMKPWNKWDGLNEVNRELERFLASGDSKHVREAQRLSLLMRDCEDKYSVLHFTEKAITL